LIFYEVSDIAVYEIDAGKRRYILLQKIFAE